MATISDKRAYQGTASTTPDTVEFSERKRLIAVTNLGDTNNLLVCVPEIHGDQFGAIPPGGSLPFGDDKGIGSIIVKTAASTTDYDVSALEGRASS
jgi:hypothetical protein